MFGNWIKTTILMAGIVALFGAMGAAIGGQPCGFFGRRGQAHSIGRRNAGTE